MTIKKLEEITGKFCDKYCMYSKKLCHEDEQETLDEICKSCPMNEMFELIDMLSPSEKNKGEKKKVKHKSITAVQNKRNHHVTLFNEDGTSVMHCAFDKPITEGELRSVIDNYFYLKEGLTDKEQLPNCSECDVNECVHKNNQIATVYDKIKTMDIDALANVIYCANDQVCFNNCKKETGNKYACKFGSEVTVENCKDCIKSWLKSEAKVDE